MRSAIVVNSKVVVPEHAIQVDAVRASGPGGQNVNKVSSKVCVSIDLEAISGLDLPARLRLAKLTENRRDRDGKLQITSQETRDQGRNLEVAYEKIRLLIGTALVAPKPRKATRPSRGAVRRRLEDKRQVSERKSERKSGRGRVGRED